MNHKANISPIRLDFSWDLASLRVYFSRYVLRFIFFFFFFLVPVFALLVYILMTYNLEVKLTPTLQIRFMEILKICIPPPTKIKNTSNSNCWKPVSTNISTSFLAYRLPAGDVISCYQDDVFMIEHSNNFSLSTIDLTLTII